MSYLRQDGHRRKSCPKSLAPAWAKRLA
jgi:hypothetical protein